MKRILAFGVALLLGVLSFVIQVELLRAQDVSQPNFPQILPASTVVGRTANSPGPTEAIPFSYISTLLQPFSGLVVTAPSTLPITQNGAVASISNTTVTAAQIYGPINAGVVSNFDLTQSVLDIPAGSNLNNVAATSSYIKDESVASSGGSGSNAVGFFAAEQATSSSAAMWGVNTLLQDGPTRAINALTGITLLGDEFDFNVMSPNTSIIGASVGGNGLSQPTSALGYVVNNLGAGAKWSAGFETIDGAASTAIVVGASAASGSSVVSQPVWMLYRDGSSNRQVASVTADANAFHFTKPETTTSLDVGTSGSSAGAIKFEGATSGAAILKAQSVAGNTTFQLPTTSGTLASAASGALSLNSTTGALTVNCTGNTVVGAAGCVQQLSLGGASSTPGGFFLFNSAGTFFENLIAGPSISSSFTLALPNTSGATGQLLTSDGGTGTGWTWSGNGQIKGTATNDSATSGNTGETITGTTATASQTTATPRAATSVSLTAGDWDCAAVATYTPTASTSITRLEAGLNTSVAFQTIGTVTGTVQWLEPATIPATTSPLTMTVPTTRFSIASTTTVDLVADATFTASTMTTGGAITCTRIR